MVATPKKKPVPDKLPRTLVTRLTRGGQISLPPEARAVLGVKPGDKVYVRIENGEVKVVKPKYALEEVFGILEPPRPNFDIDEAIHEAKEEMAETHAKGSPEYTKLITECAEGYKVIHDDYRAKVGGMFARAVMRR